MLRLLVIFIVIINSSTTNLKDVILVNGDDVIKVGNIRKG